MRSSAGGPPRTAKPGSKPASGDGAGTAAPAMAAPSVSMPKGGGAIRGIGEKFSAAKVSGTATVSVPIFTSPGRSGLGPELSLSYDSGAGNGPFGLGWRLALPEISRRTDKGLPTYRDAEESDVFILSGHDDLVPALELGGRRWQRRSLVRSFEGRRYEVRRYRPRREGLFARIERWTDLAGGQTHWRSITGSNLTTLYGSTPDSRIADPADPGRVFRWLVSASYDDKGNAMLYQYAAEDSAGIDGAAASEKNRGPKQRSANRYLKRIKYGNRVSRLIQPDLSAMDWMFEVVLDYGEDRLEELPAAPSGQRQVSASLEGAREWEVRKDPFSSYRAGFELRTYRLCRHVLMFHHLPEELGVDDCLVRSTSFNYAEDAVASFMSSIEQSGYVRQDDGRYLRKSLPLLELGYSRAELDPTVRKADLQSLADTQHHLLDLDGEGLCGLLMQQGEGWFYRPNLSPLPRPGESGSKAAAPVFGPARPVLRRPAGLDAGPGGARFMDLAGDGRLDLAALGGPAPGFFERTHKRDWERFVPFESLPNLDWEDPNLALVDLTGDGHADILLTENQALSWHPSLAERGFGEARRRDQALDEEAGPKLVLANGERSVHLADMSGDGLSDLVRIKNGQVCYWPNLGYGRFGAKVTMDQSPWFDEPDQFDPARLRLADIDGSGVTDLIYQARDGVRLFLNESGNSWRKGAHIKSFPSGDDLASLAVLDLMGNGTACLVWSSSLPAEAQSPLRYVELTGGIKPHLLTSLVNNLGGETRIRYAPATRFYLQDQAAGRPWITRLPFPVQVVERVETIDRICNHRYVNRFAYHHGHFDGHEREFRGFGMVEQWDTQDCGSASSASGQAAENLEEASWTPPILTRTWYHTGAYVEGEAVSRVYEKEYYREPGLTEAEFRAQLLPDTVLPPGLGPAEMREACRALKSKVLRREVYGLDGSEQSAHPYTVSESNVTLKLLQPRAGNRHAVFFAHPDEALNYHYERNPHDPRVSHDLVLGVDEFGNVLQAVKAAYGRRSPDASLEPADREPQMRTHLTCEENRFTNSIDDDEAYRTPLPCEARTLELTGLDPPPGRSRFSAAQIRDALAAAVSIPPEEAPTEGRLQKRIMQQGRRIYRRDDLSGPLPLGDLQPLALPYESYTLEFTPGLLSQAYETRVTGDMLRETGYINHDGDPGWWIPSGRVFYAPQEEAEPAGELAFAREHFFLPHRQRDPLGNSQVTTYDPYCLLVQEARDAVGNRITAGERDPAGNLMTSGNDYRVLAPGLVMDPNRNIVEVAFDALGMTVGMATRGKPEESRGDSLAGFEADLPDSVITGYMENPLSDPAALLGRATKRTIRDLLAYRRTRDDPQPQPAVVCNLARETHDADLEPGQTARLIHSFAYSDGQGRAVQQKTLAEPGPLAPGGGVGSAALGEQRLDRFEQQGRAGSSSMSPFLARTTALNPCGRGRPPPFSTMRRGGASAACIRTKATKRWYSIPGAKKPGISMTPYCRKTPQATPIWAAISGVWPRPNICPPGMGPA
jgi:hypothetical protein